MKFEAAIRGLPATAPKEAIMDWIGGHPAMDWHIRMEVEIILKPRTYLRPHMVLRRAESRPPCCSIRESAGRVFRQAIGPPDELLARIFGLS